MVYGNKDDKKARRVVVQKVRKEPEEPIKVEVPVKKGTREPIKMVAHRVDQSEEPEEKEE